MMKNIKQNIITRFRKGVLICLSSAVLVACNNDDFFILRDRGGMDAAIWDAPGAVDMHLNKTYDLIIPKFQWQTVPDRFELHLISDELYVPGIGGSIGGRGMGVVGLPLINHDVRYTGNAYNNNFLANRYMDIARCNNAIKYLPEGGIEESKKREFLGQYHAMRAMVYFELVKVYGGVPLVLEPQDPDNITTEGRASARRCFDVILDDLDKAMGYLEGVAWSSDNWGRITAVAARALKAKVLLYWASPQFNPVDDPRHPYDQSRWQVALQANQEAYDRCLSAGRALVPNYANIFRTKGSANTETIISRPYSNTRSNRGHDTERQTRPQSEDGSPHNGYRATLKLLQAYPMKDGNPIGESNEYTYDNVLFWKDRDPRFEATFAYNGSIWPLSGNTNRRQWTYEGATNSGRSEGANWGVYCKRFSTPDLAFGNVRVQNGIGGSGMDWIEMRLAEVMLNLADCANETGNLSLAKDMLRQIRQRADIEPGTNDYGLGNISNIEDMRELILNERFIEFAFENKRHSDLRRTREWHKLSGEWIETIRIEVQYDNQHPDASRLREAKIIQLETVDEATGTSLRDRLDINNREVYLEHFKPALVVNQPNGYRPIDIPAHHIFYTFHDDFVRRGQNIEPTIGWAGGTFDPLDDQ